MYFAGFDPSSTNLGYALIDEEGAVVYGTFKAGGKKPTARLVTLRDQLAEWLANNRDDIVYAAVEEPFFTRKVQRSALMVAGGYWSVVFECYGVGLPLATVKPSQVKSAGGLSPNASKGAVIDAVVTMFQLPTKPNDHEADALLIATYAKWSAVTGQTVTQL